jgi:hypothetical protein
MFEKTMLAYQSIVVGGMALTVLALFSSPSYSKESSNPNSEPLPQTTSQPSDKVPSLAEVD